MSKQRRRLVKNIGWANQNIVGKVVKSDKYMGISQLLGARARAAPKVYAYVSKCIVWCDEYQSPEMLSLLNLCNVLQKQQCSRLHDSTNESDDALWKATSGFIRHYNVPEGS